MEKKTIEMLRNMICEELEEISKKGQLGSHENLDIVKDLLDSMKNLYKIEKYKGEIDDMEEKSMAGRTNMNGSYDNGYSQRKYYIDADYNPYRPNSYDMGMSQRRMNYDNSYGGNSYYYDPRYDMPMYSMGRGYARHGDKNEMISELQQMMNEAQDEKVKSTIQKAIAEMGK